MDTIYNEESGLAVRNKLNANFQELNANLQNLDNEKVNKSDIADNLTTDDATKVLSAAQGKVLNDQLQALKGSLVPKGVWNAATNTPDIFNETTTGYYWIVSVDGNTSVGGITDWKVNDWVVKTEDGWAKVDNSESVISINGKVGAVSLTKDDIGLDAVDNTRDEDKPISQAVNYALTNITNSFSSGIFIPTIISITSGSADKINPMYWVRIGNIVSFSGNIHITGAAAAAYQYLKITVPVLSNFTNYKDASGTVSSANGTVFAGHLDARSSTSQLTIVFQGMSAGIIMFSGTYIIK